MGNTAYLCPILLGNPLLLANGAVNYNGNVWTFLTGTSILSNTFQNGQGTANNPNPMQTSVTTGRLPNQIWISTGQNTDIIITDSSNNVLNVQNSVIGIDDPTYINASIGPTANAAYGEANAAFSQALTSLTIAEDALIVAANAQQLANLSANLVALYCNNSLISANTNLNFNNSATTLINVIPNNIVTGANTGVQANVSWSINLPSVGLAQANGSSNGWCNVTSNVAFQWGVVNASGSLSQTISVVFPRPFTNVCYSVVTTSTSSGNSNELSRPYSVNKAGFTLDFDGFGGTSSPTDVYWFAVGNA